MAQDKQKFELNLSGLLKVLAEHLYSTKKVAIRELIQNAHDSCVRRQAEDTLSNYRPKIRLWSDARTKTLVIQDNGAGMTKDEIVTYLTTIGNSYTRELEENIQFLSPEYASRLIGQFGLGFLSSFLIAQEVKLITRSYKGEETYRWFCDGSEYFDLQPYEAAEIGTLIEIKVKPEAQFLLEANVLTETVRKYADFLEVPLYVNDDPTSVNMMQPPWLALDREYALREYISRVFEQDDVICAIELHDQTVDLGHDSFVIPLRGFVFIPPTSVVSLREYGDLMIYIRHMFITEDDRKLMPKWARFFRGVIDCPALQPTASREGIHEDDYYLAVQQALETQMLTGLKTIANEQPEIWRRIILGHTELVLGWVVINNEFFEKVADFLLLRTTRGMLSMSEYLEQSGNVFYFTKHELGSLQEQMLGEGYEVPVIDASRFTTHTFLEKYAAWRDSIRLVQMDGDARQLMRSVSEDDYIELLNFFRAKNIVARVAAFKPVSVPAIVVYPRNADTMIEARRAIDSGQLSSPLEAMLTEFLHQQKGDDDDDPMLLMRGVLYLNASSPLIQQLITKAPEKLDIVLTLIHQIARLFAGRNLTPVETSEAFREVSDSIGGLLKND